jgi:hypothetical protein
VKQTTIAVPGLPIILQDGERDPHIFSVLRELSNVLSVVISVTNDMSPVGDLLATLIFLRGGVLLGLFTGPCVFAPTLQLAGRSTPFVLAKKRNPR